MFLSKLFSGTESLHVEVAAARVEVGAARVEGAAAAAGKSFVFQIFLKLNFHQLHFSPRHYYLHLAIIYFGPYYISSCALLNFFYTITHLKIF
jgi:hypothetical protein